MNLTFLNCIFLISKKEFYNTSKSKFLFTGNKRMAASYLPSILVPLVGLVFPAIAMASLFLYVEQEQIN